MASSDAQELERVSGMSTAVAPVHRSLDPPLCSHTDDGNLVRFKLQLADLLRCINKKMIG
jgi:hypothetical protein